MRLQSNKTMSDGGFALSNEKEGDSGLTKARKAVGSGHSQTKERHVSMDDIDRQDDVFTGDQIQNMGIGARVAAKYRSGQQSSNRRRIDIRNTCLDERNGMDDSGDSDYRDDEGDSAHSSEDWPDSEDLADSNIIQPWPWPGRNPKAAKFSSDFCPNPRRLASPFEMVIGMRRKERKIERVNSFPLQVSKKPIKKSGAGIDWGEDKWPPFDWMLDNFREDDSTTCY